MASGLRVQATHHLALSSSDPEVHSATCDICWSASGASLFLLAREEHPTGAFQVVVHRTVLSMLMLLPPVVRGGGSGAAAELAVAVAEGCPPLRALARSEGLSADQAAVCAGRGVTFSPHGPHRLIGHR